MHVMRIAVLVLCFVVPFVKQGVGMDDGEPATRFMTGAAGSSESISSAAPYTDSSDGDFGDDHCSQLRYDLSSDAEEESGDEEEEIPVYYADEEPSLIDVEQNSRFMRMLMGRQGQNMQSQVKLLSTPQDLGRGLVRLFFTITFEPVFKSVGIDESPYAFVYALEKLDVARAVAKLPTQMRNYDLEVRRYYHLSGIKREGSPVILLKMDQAGCISDQLAGIPQQLIEGYEDDLNAAVSELVTFLGRQHYFRRIYELELNFC